MSEVVIAFKGSSAWRQHKQAAKRGPTRRYSARVAHQLALAHALRRRLERRGVRRLRRHGAAARLHTGSLTQLMDLLLLAPEVQEEILFFELPPGAQPVRRRGLREAMLGMIDWLEQQRRWEELKARLTRVGPGREGATP